MSRALYDLRPTSSYDPGVPFELARFREALKRERKTRVGGRDKLADRAGVNKTTIQNAESGPDIPKIDTIARLVEAMPGLSLSAFFLQIEQPSSDQGNALHKETEIITVTPSVGDSSKGGGDAHSVSGDRDDLSALAVQVAIYNLKAVIAAARSGEGADRPPQPLRPTRAPESRRRKRTVARK